MPCNNWNDDWIATLYGELEPAEQRALDEHLRECDACRRTLDELRATRELLQDEAFEVPASPRVVVLRPRPLWTTAWAFAAGAACALLLFGVGFWAGPRWTRAVQGAGPSPVPTETARSAGPDVRETAGDVAPSASVRDHEMEQDLLALRQRLEHLENRPSEDGLTPEQLRAELDRLERRFRQERVRDLEYVVRTLTASEHRVGTWMDQTQEALTLVALRQDPRFSEQ
jgi:hypothetical protein